MHEQRQLQDAGVPKIARARLVLAYEGRPHSETSANRPLSYRFRRTAKRRCRITPRPRRARPADDLGAPLAAVRYAARTSGVPAAHPADAISFGALAEQGATYFRLPRSCVTLNPFSLICAAMSSHAISALVSPVARPYFMVSIAITGSPIRTLCRVFGFPAA